MARRSEPIPFPDQADRLRELARGRSGRPFILAVSSGKGGVGKSNVAVNLSICLAAESLNVTLVDMDIGLANADLLMDVHPRYTLGHVLSGLRTMTDIALEGPGGIRFIPGASGCHESANLSDFDRRNLVHQLQNLSGSTDIVVLDCGAGLSRNVLDFALAADEVLVVTTPQPTALTDAYATVKALHREGCRARIGLFVNMARNKSEALATYRRLAGVAQKFLDYPVADRGYMLHDTTVELAVRDRCPFVIRFPASNASACIAAMAGELARSVGGSTARGGLLKRVIGLFV